MITKIVIEIEIEGTPAEAFSAVDQALDLGHLQKAVEELGDDVRVVSALVQSLDRCAVCHEPNCHCIVCGTPCNTECVGPDHDYRLRGEAT